VQRCSSIAMCRFPGRRSSMYSASSSTLGQSKPQKGAIGTTWGGFLSSVLFTIRILARVTRITIAPGSLLKAPSNRFLHYALWPADHSGSTSSSRFNNRAISSAPLSPIPGMSLILDL
jgi:hypothetical protein